jgi:hypothetical protein
LGTPRAHKNKSRTTSDLKKGQPTSNSSQQNAKQKGKLSKKLRVMLLF